MLAFKFFKRFYRVLASLCLAHIVFNTLSKPVRPLIFSSCYVKQKRSTSVSVLLAPRASLPSIFVLSLVIGNEDLSLL